MRAASPSQILVHNNTENQTMETTAQLASKGLIRNLKSANPRRYAKKNSIGQFNQKLKPKDLIFT